VKRLPQNQTLHRRDNMKLDSIPVRKIIVYALCILLLPSIQVTMSHHLTFWGNTADLMLVFAVLAGFLYGFYEGIIVGGITGIARDVLAAPIIPGNDNSFSVAFGIGVLVLFLAGAFGAVFFEGRTKRNLPLGILAVLCYTVIYKVVGHLTVALWENLMAGMPYSISIGTIIKTSILPQLLMNGIASVLIFGILKLARPVERRGRNKKELTYGENGNWLTI